mmetsp:Transcript_33573/g.72578  ORF Transcript_33573/g.72578 Transcript_33573/m.72578 type:complete len:341 (-) Transcript_33573:214-1236(-)
MVCLQQSSSMSQTRTVLSLDPLKSRQPSEECASVTTGPLCPRKITLGSMVSRCHTLTMVSAPAVQIILSLRKTMLLMNELWALVKIARSSSCGDFRFRVPRSTQSWPPKATQPPAAHSVMSGPHWVTRMVFSATTSKVRLSVKSTSLSPIESRWSSVTAISITGPLCSFRNSRNLPLKASMSQTPTVPSTPPLYITSPSSTSDTTDPRWPVSRSSGSRSTRPMSWRSPMRSSAALEERAMPAETDSSPRKDSLRAMELARDSSCDCFCDPPLSERSLPAEEGRPDTCGPSPALTMMGEKETFTSPSFSLDMISMVFSGTFVHAEFVAVMGSDATRQNLVR